jgi:hypothetical protein
MSMKVNRQTVDLSQYPNLVVIYLGMRVNRLTGLKTLFGFGPKIANSVTARPMACCCTRTLFSRSFPCTPACANTGAIRTHFLPGRAPSPIVNGGRIFCATPAAPASGTRPTSCRAAWKPSTTMYLSPSDSCASLPSHLLAAPCSAPPIAPANHTRAKQLSAKKNSTDRSGNK